MSGHTAGGVFAVPAPAAAVGVLGATYAPDGPLRGAKPLLPWKDLAIIAERLVPLPFSPGSIGTMVHQLLKCGTT